MASVVQPNRLERDFHACRWIGAVSDPGKVFHRKRRSLMTALIVALQEVRSFACIWSNLQQKASLDERQLPEPSLCLLAGFDFHEFCTTVCWSKYLDYLIWSSEDLLLIENFPGFLIDELTHYMITTTIV